jgi:hypothetical protein
MSPSIGVRMLGVVLTWTAASAWAPAAGAQRIQLVLRPRVGDTISMRLEQQTEVSGKRDASKIPAAPSAGAPSSGVVTNTVTYSRAAIESAVAAFTTIVAITDSVFISSTDQQGKASPAATQRQLQGQRVRLTVAPDGSIGMPNDGSAPTQGMSRTASLIPATFPAKPVAVGDKWTREAPLPAGTSQLGTGIVGKVKATFRLDSITHGGDFAYVSMHGELLPDAKAKGTDGVPIVEDGTVDGYMVVDHIRGWLTESQFTIVAHSTLRPSFGVVSQPMYFEIRLTQKLETIAKR